MIKTFRVAKYKNFVDTELNFGKINVFIGPNNSGKSNFIEAMQLGAELYGSGQDSHALQTALKRRGWHKILNNTFQHDDSAILKYTVSLNDLRLEVELDINISSPDSISHGFYIAKEIIRPTELHSAKQSGIDFISCHGEEQGKAIISLHTPDRQSGGSHTKKYSFKITTNDVITNQLKLLYLNSSFRTKLYIHFKDVVDRCHYHFGNQLHYSFSDIIPRVVSAAAKCEMGRDMLNAKCTDILDVLLYLEREHNFLETYQDILDMAIHDLESIKIHPLGQEIYSLQATINKQKFSFSDLSDGSIRMFVLALLLHTPERYTVLSLDEPELNLHPAWLKLLGKWMMRGTSFDQLFISTHSPDLLDVFTEAFREGEASIYVFDLKEGPRQLAPSEVADFLDQGWELGDLYRVGEPQVGGWPW